jgi:NADPH:quinone reductase-like Zn-dependent oxidoreductase
VLELTGGRGADMVLDTIGGALFEPAVKSLRFGGRLTGLHNHERVEFNPSEIYDHDRHVTGLASVFIDGADGAKIFDQLAPLFDRGLLTPPATNTWPLKDSVEAYQRVQDGAHGIKQVLLPSGSGA